MVTVNQMLLLGGVAVAGYLVWTNQSTITSFIQSITNPPAAATASGSSSLTLSGGAPSSVTGGPTGCANGSVPDPTTGLCSDGSAPIGQGLAPGPSPVGTGVNNSLITGIPPQGVVPTVSGGADVGGPQSDSGPTFTDPITGQTYNPGTGQILSPGGSTQVPNFAPFVEPGVGSANLGPPGGAVCPNGSRWSQCFGQCMPAGILEPAPGDPRCLQAAGQGGQCVQTQMCMVGYVWDPNLCRCVQAGLQTGNPQTSTSPNVCPNGQPANADGTCPVTPTPPPPPAPTPAPTTPACPAGTYWNPVVQQCNYPIVTQTPAPSTPPTVTQAPPTPTTVTPPTMQTPAPTPTPVSIPAPTTTTASQATTNCKCCEASPHNGNCHSECCWGKCMTSSKCTSCLACCGDYEGNACKSSKVGYAYTGRFDNNLMTFANEGTMIADAVQQTSPVGRAIGKRYPTRRGARVVSRTQKVTAANPITAQIFARPFNFPNRVAVS